MGQWKGTILLESLIEHKNSPKQKSAIISYFKSNLSQTDRLHVAYHGNSDYGGTVELWDDDLNSPEVNSWSTQGYRCKLVFLSSCSSMVSNNLASAIISKSGVDQVLGYDDEVDAGGAATFAGLFWSYHLWADGADGGVSSDTAIDNAKDDIHDLISDAAIQALIGSLITSAVISIIVAIIALIVPEFPWIVGIIASILVSLFSVVQMMLFINSLNSAYYHIDE